jgi:hypothetical protein
MWSSAILTTTGQSPGLGTIKVPRRSNRESNATPAMAERIVVVQSGDTCATIALVAGQVMPQENTTTANSVIAVCRGRVSLIGSS